MIDHFIDVLRKVGLACTYQDLADTLWLARFLPSVMLDTSTSGTLTPETPDETSKRERTDYGTAWDASTETHEAGRQQAGESLVYASFSKGTRRTTRTASKVRIPGAVALPRALEIGRALRPLTKRFPSRRFFVLDEEATVHRIAEGGPVTPVFRPQQERWFDVAFVVEKNPTMGIWQQTLAEMSHLLQQHGAFQDVRRWTLEISDGTVRIADPSGTVRNAMELQHPEARRLILVVSDCVSTAWRDGTMTKALRRWAATTPVTVVQVLSKRLWGHTALGEATAQVRSLLPGVPNSQLLVEEDDPLWDVALDDAGGASTRKYIPIPVITLDPASISRWSRMIMATGTSAPGVLLYTSEDLEDLEEPEEGVLQDGVPDPEQRLQQFRALVSPTAFKLATYLSVVPLTLPVMRLVQATMLPKSSQVHLAEVFLGGVIERTTPADEQRPVDEVDYDFYAGVRYLLEVSLLKSEVIEVWQSLSTFIEKRIGQPLDFAALIASDDGDIDIPESALPFAHIGAKALKRLGLILHDQKQKSVPTPIDLDAIGRSIRDIKIAPATKPAHIFISYRHQEPDRTLAHVFADALKKAGHDVFIDTGIRWGADWMKRIREALEKTDYLLVFLSREAAQSEMTVEEIMIARELAQQRNGVPIILPIRILLPFTDPLPYLLSAYLRSIGQESWNGEEDTPRLITQLLEILAEKTGWLEGTQEEASGGVREEIPQPHMDPRDFIIPGGALEVDTSLYIMRDADEEVLNAVRRKRALVTVRGPRQTGKTSLIMRVYAAMRGSSKEVSQLRTAFIDFQALPHDDFQTLDTIWRTMAEDIAYQLSLNDWDASHWRPNANYDRNFTRFLDRFVFKDNKTPVLICLDEVDRLFKTPIKTDFFSSVRAFYNRGAFDPVWRNVRWLLATSSEPSFFIEDLTQSPFNIGLRVELNTFTQDEVKKLAAHHGLKTDPAALDEMMDYVGGHPYLTHLLVYHLAQDATSHDQLFDAETAGGGVFREHLHRFLIGMHEEKTLVRAMQQIIRGKGCDDARIANRLEAAGLVRQDENQKIVPLCRLYADFFSNELE